MLSSYFPLNNMETRHTYFMPKSPQSMLSRPWNPFSSFLCLSHAKGWRDCKFSPNLSAGQKLREAMARDNFLPRTPYPTVYPNVQYSDIIRHAFPLLFFPDDGPRWQELSSICRHSISVYAADLTGRRIQQLVLIDPYVGSTIFNTVLSELFSSCTIGGWCFTGRAVQYAFPGSAEGGNCSLLAPSSPTKSSETKGGGIKRTGRICQESWMHLGGRGALKKWVSDLRFSPAAFH